MSYSNNADLTTRGWKSPPYYAVVRGPFGKGGGYQVATIAREDDSQNKIVLLYSRREKAQRHLQRNPQGHSDWTVGTLENWQRLAYFLDSMRGSARRVCLDFDREGSGAEVAWPLEEVLAKIKERARRESEDSGSGKNLGI